MNSVWPHFSNQYFVGFIYPFCGMVAPIQLGLIFLWLLGKWILWAKMFWVQFFLSAWWTDGASGKICSACTILDVVPCCFIICTCKNTIWPQKSGNDIISRSNWWINGISLSTGVISSLNPWLLIFWLRTCVVCVCVCVAAWVSIYRGKYVCVQLLFGFS